MENLQELLSLTVKLAADIVKYSDAVNDKKRKQIKEKILQNIKDKSEVIAGICRNLK